MSMVWAAPEDDKDNTRAELRNADAAERLARVNLDRFLEMLRVIRQYLAARRG